MITAERLSEIETAPREACIFKAEAKELAASAIHQIGGTLESKSMLPGNTLLADLTNEMRKCAGDILETVKSDPWMFYVLINTAVSSGVLKLIDMKGESDG